jgi:hypothetical protein
MGTIFPFKWRHFGGDVMPLCVRWYLRYALSDRDVKDLARVRQAIGGPHHRVPSVQRYASELDRWCRPSLCGRRSHHITPVEDVPQQPGQGADRPRFLCTADRDQQGAVCPAHA